MTIHITSPSYIGIGMDMGIGIGMGIGMGICMGKYIDGDRISTYALKSKVVILVYLRKVSEKLVQKVKSFYKNVL